MTKSSSDQSPKVSFSSMGPSAEDIFGWRIWLTRRTLSYSFKPSEQLLLIQTQFQATEIFACFSCLMLIQCVRLCRFSPFERWLTKGIHWTRWLSSCPAGSYGSFRWGTLLLAALAPFFAMKTWSICSVTVALKLKLGHGLPGASLFLCRRAPRWAKAQKKTASNI